MTAQLALQVQDEQSTITRAQMLESLASLRQDWEKPSTHQWVSRFDPARLRCQAEFRCRRTAAFIGHIFVRRIVSLFGDADVNVMGNGAGLFLIATEQPI